MRVLLATCMPLGRVVVVGSGAELEGVVCWGLGVSRMLERRGDRELWCFNWSKAVEPKCCAWAVDLRAVGVGWRRDVVWDQGG